MNMQFANLMDVLLWREAPQAGTRDKTAFTFLQDGSSVSDTMTFAELAHAAKSIAAHLMQCSQPGDRVLLLYPPSLDFIKAFFACIMSGRIAVPAIPPSGSRHLERLHAILDDAGADVVLTTPTLAQRIGGNDAAGKYARLSRLVRLATGTLPDLAAQWQSPRIAPDDIAFLQYTSGSTGTPKGVMVSHANLIANITHAQRLTGAGEHDVGVSWLPPYHDFGLIAGIVGAVYAGSHCVQIPSSAFLMQPYLWLKALTTYRARVTGAPNFAYELCARRVSAEQKAELDLSTLEIAFNGAEPIRPSTLRKFAEAFAGCHFRPSAMTPGYGLAESTLLVTMNRHQRQKDGMPAQQLVSRTALALGRVDSAGEADDMAEFVNVGAALPGHDIIIVGNHNGQAYITSEVGEIWVRGPSVCAGYWNRPDLNADTFGACIDGRAGRYLRTGDLGFFRGPDLFITGRVKEVMIFDGRNIYPQDVEQTLEAMDPAYRPLSSAAFSVDRGQGDELVLVQELELQARADVAALVPRIRAEMAEQHGIMRIAAILLVKAGSLPRTTSGKIQRGLCRQMFQEQRFSPVWEWHDSQVARSRASAAVAPVSATEQALLAIWESCTGGNAPGVDDDFLSVGGHSLLAVQLIARIQTHFQVDLPIQAVFEANTIRSLAARIDLAPRHDAAACLPIPVAARDGRVPLSHAQQRLWFIDQLEGGGRSTYSIPLALRLRGALDAGALQGALDAIVARHDILRTVFDTADGKPFQVIASALAVPLPVTDLGAFADPDAQQQRLLQEEANRGFDLRSGPLLRAGLLRRADDDHVLMLTIHHINADGWSIGVMLRDLAEHYAARIHGRTPLLPPLPLQYADFACWQSAMNDESNNARDLAWWREELDDAPTLDLPTDFRRPAIASGRGGLIARLLTDPARIDAFAREAGTTRFPILLAAFLVLLQRYSGQDDFCVGTPVANRMRAELEPLIGFFANTVVLRARLAGDPSFRELVGRARQTAQNALVHQNLPFEQLVDALGGAREPGRTPLFQVMFVLQNSIGELAALPGLDCEPLLVDSGSAKFDLTLSIVPEGGRMHAVFEYNADVFASDSIAQLADHYLRLLDAMLAQPDAAISAVSIHDEVMV